MSNARNNSEKKESVDYLTGCNAMQVFWRALEDCRINDEIWIRNPSSTGVFSPLIKCSNLRQHMKDAKIQCWEERTRPGANPNTLFSSTLVSSAEKNESKNVSNQNNQNSTNLPIENEKSVLGRP